ncbi:unnamed protein product [Tetraodon nigroviridis]|uniref:(spotted green pufferfish) hypothetical protein n=1 Tax=Tetraodon nigroviridis TaxID=99883 RepID=Q4RLC1_TETNG|nr:unnamed protein product [Tetraodon nigroviridis]
MRWWALLLLLAGWGSLVSVRGSPAVEQAYGAVVELVSPGQQNLTADALLSVFNRLQHRVQCGEVPCEQCDLFGALDQLLGNQTVLRVSGSSTGEGTTAVGLSQFPVFAAGCLLYLSSPILVCAAVKQGLWGERTSAFIHKLAHTDGSDGHERMDLSGLTVLIHQLHHHYRPNGTESCVTARDIMAEVNASSPEQNQETGAVLGRVLFHTLQGRCVASRPLPEESFFLDFLMAHLGTENFTAVELKVLMKSLNLGPRLDAEAGHDHQDDEHAQHDHGGRIRRDRGRAMEGTHLG